MRGVFYLSLSVLMLAASALALAEVRAIVPEEQTGSILYSSEESKAVTPERSSLWKDFCDRMVKNLLVTASPAGFLKSANCGQLGELREAGRKSKKSEKPLWLIEIVERKGLFEIQTSFLVEEGSYQKVWTHTFKMESDLLKNLKSDEIAAAIARMLVESLPTGWIYTHNAEQEAVKFTTDKNLPNLPPDLLVYDLSYDTTAKKWLPRIRARMNRVAEASGLKERSETFKFTQVYLPLVDKKLYWIQSSNGLNKRQADYEKVLGKNMDGLTLLNFLDKLIFDNLASNYAGFRYGKSFLGGSSIVTETSLFSLLVEMRSGLFNGLRYYYDLTPEKRKGSGESSENFSMSRGSIGWAFDFEMPTLMQWLVSKVEVQPKFGGLQDAPPTSTLTRSASPRAAALV